MPSLRRSPATWSGKTLDVLVQNPGQGRGELAPPGSGALNLAYRWAGYPGGGASIAHVVPWRCRPEQVGLVGEVLRACLPPQRSSTSVEPEDYTGER